MNRLFFILALIVFCSGQCCAKDFGADDLLSLLVLNSKTTKQHQVTALLGQPAKVEESKKRTKWYYDKDNTKLIVCWSNRSDELVKFSFSNLSKDRCTFDDRLSRRLRSGRTCIKEAMTLLGPPKEMTVKELTQEMHYAYKNSMLRLFFRNGVLVDFTLLGRK